MDLQLKYRRIGLFVLVAVLALALLVCSVIVIDNLVYEDLPESKHERKTIWLDGVSYFPRQDIRIFLLMGIDRIGPAVDSGSYKNEGAADVVLVFIFYDATKEYQILALNRDTMVEMPVLGLRGKKAGTKTAQLALSHTYGNGLKQSCVNTKTTVSNLLLGANIHHYISMNMDAISILTDAVGGVKVNITDDFSLIDSTLKKGELTLNGEQAFLFLRTRKDVGDQLNLSRMDRHEEFMNGFIEAYRTNIGNNISKAMEIFDQISPYVVTDCTDHIIVDLLNRFYDYELIDVMSPTGTNVRGDEYMEFYVDEEKLYQLILSLFYSPKNQ